MARQLVGEAQIRIDDFLVVDQDTIVELAAVYQARLLQLLDVPQKPKVLAGAISSLKQRRTVVEVGVLLDAHGLRIIQNIVHRENIRRLDADRLTPLAPDSIRSINHDFGPFLAFFLNANFVNEITELYGGTVQNGNLP